MREQTAERHDQIVQSRGPEIRIALTVTPNARAVGHELGIPSEVVRHVKRQLPASTMRRKANPKKAVPYDAESIRQTLSRIRKDTGNGIVSEGVYVEHRRPTDPSLARLQQIYGKWNDMLRSFDLPTHPSSGERAQYTRDDCVSAVAACAADLGTTPTYPQYDRWARNQADTPSGGTVRNRMGRWLVALAEAGL